MLFGDRFNDFLKGVYENATPEIREAIDWRMAKGEGMLEAVDEVIARIAERTDFSNVDRGFWSKITDLFNGMLEKLGFKTKITEDDLKQILKASYANLMKTAEERTGRNEGEEDFERVGEAEGESRFSFSKSREEFEETQKRAVEQNGIVIPGLKDKKVIVEKIPWHNYKGDRPNSQAEKWAKNNIVGFHTLIDSDGKEVQHYISGRTVGKYLSDSAVKKSENLGVHLSVLNKLIDIMITV